MCICLHPSSNTTSAIETDSSIQLLAYCFSWHFPIHSDWNKTRDLWPEWQVGTLTNPFPLTVANKHTWNPSGKNTLISTILRLVQPQSGSITLDGVNSQDVHPCIVRSRVIVISQDTCLYTGTVRFNIDPCSQSCDADMWRALERLRLPHTITGMGGLDSKISLDLLS